MRLRPLSLTASALLAGASLASAAPQLLADRPVLWSVHFNDHRLRTGVGKDVLAALGPILDSLSKTRPNTPGGGTLEAVAFYGFEPHHGAKDDLPFLADFCFSPADGGITPRFEAICKKHALTVETLAGYPAVHFAPEDHEIWVAKQSDTRVFVSTARALLEAALQPGADALTPASSEKPDELLGGSIEMGRLIAGDPALQKSELLKLLPHLDFHVTGLAGQRFNVDAAADLDSEHSAKRAVRIIEGMAAALSLRNNNGINWDDRLDLKQDGAHLTLQLPLDAGEIKGFIERFAHEFGAQINAGSPSDE